MGRILDARTRLVNALTAANLAVVTDPRDARPRTVIIDPPTMTRSTGSGLGSQVMLEFNCTVVAAPPGNQDALDWLSDAVDTITSISTVAATQATPGIYSVGGQELPCYTITVMTVGY